MVSHPKKTCYITEAKIKSGRVDSKTIAELVKLEALPLAYFPTGQIAELREKVRRRAFLVRERVKFRELSLCGTCLKASSGCLVQNNSNQQIGGLVKNCLLQPYLGNQ